MTKRIWRGFLRGWYRIIDLLKKAKYRSCRSLSAYATWFRGFQYNKPKHTLRANKTLVVCAHPDDETIFFSSVLREKHPFVLCMSNCGHKIRRKEFEAALKRYGVEGCMMNAPDTKGLTWYWHSNVLIKKLTKVRRSFPDVKTVYTHNTIGESEHPHHFGLGNAVRSVWSDCELYFTAKVPDPQNALSEEDHLKKYQTMENCYPSQLKMLTTWCPWYPDYMRCEGYEKL